MHEFDSKDLKRLFGIPPSQVRALIRAGHIHPLKKAGRLSYSFQDLIVLRTAGSLRAAKIPAQRINRTLREIRESLPGTLPLSGLSIVAVGDRIMVREGQALSASLKTTGIFPPLSIDMIEVGESTGALPVMLTSVAEFYEEDVNTRMAAALSLIEPAIMIFMGCFVAFVLISLYLPIFSLADTIR